MTPSSGAPRVAGGPFAEMLKSKASALRKPLRVVDLPLSAWAECADKPAAVTPIGLRVPSDEEERRAADEATKAVPMFASQGDLDDRIAAYNSALIAELVACATCQSVDVTRPFFEMAAVDVRRRLTSAGIQRLWQEYEILKTASEPGISELDVEGLAHLTAMLDRAVAFEHMPREEAKRLRRLLEHVRLTLAETEERAERAGVAVLATGTAALIPAEEPRSDIESVLGAMERREKRT